ncbi:MAG TPA: helix-turn-helix transcriptional regulator [Fimbriimonadaceae bacterium]|nr:helix-turn-helix transcriptional regulator [Fimbriimonadaceae bacterium]
METSSLARSFGEAVRRLRKERGFSQEGFADHCGIHRTYMGSIERGEKVVSIDMAAKLAAGLDLTLAGLFREVEHQ